LKSPLISTISLKSKPVQHQALIATEVKPVLI